jgi:hypothetical protein
MNVDEALSKAAELLDEQVAVARADEMATMLRHNHPTDEEIEVFIRERDAVWNQWRIDTLATLRSRFEQSWSLRDQPLTPSLATH